MGNKTSVKNKSLKYNRKEETQIIKLFQKITKSLMEIYVLFYLCIFPLCMHDKYFDVLSFRFNLFWKPTLVYVVIFIILGLLYIMCDALYNDGLLRKNYIRRIKHTFTKGKEEKYKEVNGLSENRFKHLCNEFHINNTDIAITVLILSFIVSTVFAEYPYEAFWGDRGRYQGLLLWLMFYAAYWLVTRFYDYKKWHIWAYMFFSAIVAIWGICNFFLITFGMFENADEIFKYTFVSSIGNINTYTNFTGMFYAVAVSAFIRSKKYKTQAAAFLAVVVASFAQIMGLSDNAVISTGIVLVAAPFVLCSDFGQITKHCTAISIYLGALKIVSVITKSGIPTMNDPDPSIQITMAGKGWFIYFLIAVFLITGVFIVKAFKEKSNIDKGSKGINYINVYKLSWGVFLAAGFIILVTVFILANNGWNRELLNPYKNILIFNDSWGTGRGLNWRLALEYWRNDATLFAKIFGYGPDTYYIITMDRFLNIMQDAGYGMFDSAHNEYIEYFLTIGILGLTAYLAFIYVSLRKMFRSGVEISKIMAMGVLAYTAQAVINIAIPITTPVFMVIMFVGLSPCGKS